MTDDILSEILYNIIMIEIMDKLKNLPDTSGVYLMRDVDGEILYIGKARSLKKRVSQYFSSYGTSTEKVMALMSRVRDFNYIITPSEVDALVLENNLIKKHKPYYNILLKDDKSYPFIRIDVKEDYPCIEIIRKVKDDGARYFGPYMQGITTKDITELIQSTFPIRHCKNNLSSLPSNHRPCLNYHINRCLAPCDSKVNIVNYRELVDKVLQFLQGNDKKIGDILNNKMLKAAEAEEFEMALYYKERLATLDKIVRKQVTYLSKDYNLDIFGIADNGVRSSVNMMIVRGGKLVGSENTILDNASLNESSTLSEYLNQYYRTTPILADEIVTSVKAEDEDALQQLWSHKFGRKINIITPFKGVRRQLADMADKNASDHLNHYTDELNKKNKLTLGALEQLRDSLLLDNLPNRIEAYDISNISGTDKVASMVVFINGIQANKLYRRFKIKTVKGSDDYASLSETITRRLARYNEGRDESFKQLPNLILIDGGKGQLNASLKAMRESKFELNMVGLAKREEIVVREHGEDIILPRNSLALHLIQRIRDEAHRFAVTYHRKLRSERQTRSLLLEIEGIGNNRIKVLFDHFKTLDNIKNATLKELENVKGIGKVAASKIYNYYHKEETEDKE